METANAKVVILAILCLILSGVIAVGTANASSHLPDCKKNAKCLLSEDLRAAEKWDELNAKWQSFTAADVQTMLNSGADVHAKADDGWTPLHSAALLANAKVISIFVKAGADVNAKADNGWTPLHSAAWNEHAEVIPVLVKAGADVNAADSEGITPLDLGNATSNYPVIIITISLVVMIILCLIACLSQRRSSPNLFFLTIYIFIGFVFGYFLHYTYAIDPAFVGAAIGCLLVFPLVSAVQGICFFAFVRLISGKFLPPLKPFRNHFLYLALWTIIWVGIHIALGEFLLPILPLLGFSWFIYSIIVNRKINHAIKQSGIKAPGLYMIIWGTPASLIYFAAILLDKSGI